MTFEILDTFMYEHTLHLMSVILHCTITPFFTAYEPHIFRDVQYS